MKFNLNLKNISIWFAVVFITSGIVLAGNLIPTSNMPEATYISLNDIYEKLTTGATSTEKSFTPTVNTDTPTMYTLLEIFDVIYNIDVLQSVEPNLDENNIVSGVNIFGVEGIYERNLTSDIVWADSDEVGQMYWQSAFDACAAKTDGDYFWRLPTSLEAHQHYLLSNGTPPGFQMDSYWTDTVYPLSSVGAYIINMVNGALSSYVKANGLFYVRCVRSFDGGGGSGGA